MAELDVSRAIRADIAAHLDRGHSGRLSYCVPDGLRVRLADVSAVRRDVRESVAVLMAQAAAGVGTMITVTQRDPATLVVALI